jgi:mRNA interferase MazF
MGCVVNRAEVWIADLAEPRGSEPAKRRPVLIVQENALNQSRLNTVMVAPITSNMKRGRAPGNVSLSPKQSGLKVDSVVLCCQVLCLDKAFFSQPVATLSESVMSRIDSGLKIALAL